MTIPQAVRAHWPSSWNDESRSLLAEALRFQEAFGRDFDAAYALAPATAAHRRGVHRDIPIPTQASDIARQSGADIRQTPNG